MSRITEIWVAHYRLSTNQHGIAMGFSDSREGFELQVKSYCQSLGLTASHQLAPLPFRTWIKRHGMRGDYWALSERLTLKQPFIFMPYEELDTLPSTEGQTQSYLIEQILPVEALGIQLGNFFPLSVPAILNDNYQKGFFAKLDWYADYADEAAAPKMDVHDDQSPRYYVVIDANKSFFFPSAFDSLKQDCLYKGKSYENAAEVAPYLVEIETGSSTSRNFVKRIFTQHESEIFGYWEMNPTVFIRSYHDFNTVFNHLRKFTHLFGKNSEGEEKWYFFRFYDPTVLVPYLQGIAHHPNHLASFFGAKADDDSPLIDAFGARIDETFHTFMVKLLPEGTISAKIELGEVEKKVFSDMASNKFFNNEILPTVDVFFGKNTFEVQQLLQWFTEAKSHKIIEKSALIAFVKNRCYATLYPNILLTEIESQINKKYHSLFPNELAELVCERIEQQLKINNHANR